MRHALRILIVVAMLASGGCLHRAGYANYVQAGSIPVSLVGHIERKDIIEPLTRTSQRIWVLRLQTPVAVKGVSYELVEEPRLHEGVETLQMVLRPAQYRQFESFIGQDVKVSGYLFEGVNWHHHTAVLIEVVDVRAVVTAEMNDKERKQNGVHDAK